MSKTQVAAIKRKKDIGLLFFYFITYKAIHIQPLCVYIYIALTISHFW